MPTNDIILVTILAIGGILINWNIIQRDFLTMDKRSIDSIGSKKIHIKAAKRIKKKVS